jgi:hypothetical protein
VALPAIDIRYLDTPTLQGFGHYGLQRLDISTALNEHPIWTADLQSNGETNLVLAKLLVAIPDLRNHGVAEVCEGNGVDPLALNSEASIDDALTQNTTERDEFRKPFATFRRSKRL